MPKCILRRFEKNNRFYYYDVNKKHIGSNGHAKSINTKKNYYSSAGEEYLNTNIETPIGELLSEIDKFDFNQPGITLDEEFGRRVRKLFYSLISRDPNLQSEIDNKSNFIQLIPERDRHDYIACTGIELAEEKKILEGYIATIAINNTSVPFILPVCGIYSFAIGYDVFILLPISELIALAMVKNHSNTNKSIQMQKIIYEFDDENSIKLINEKAFKRQIDEGIGYVISASKEELNRVKSVIKKE